MTTPRWPGPAEASALAAIVLSSHDAVIAKTVEGVITAWNDGATLVYGPTAEQMVGRNIEVMVPPDAIDTERARHARVAQGDSESGYRCMRLRADGRSVEVVMSMSPVRDDTGQVVGVASISRPVSGKENADARFASLLEAAPDAIVGVDCSGNIVMANARVGALFGYSSNELIGASIDILIPLELWEDHTENRADVFSHPAPRRMGVGLSLQARRRDGSTFPIEVSLGTDASDGDPLVIATVRDVTDQRATEAALRVSETQLRQLAENGDLVFTLRQIEPLANLYISPGIHKLTGSGPEVLMAEPELSTKIVHPDDRDRVEAFLHAAGRAEHSASLEYRIVRADGEVRWVRTFATAVPNPDGAPERLVTTTEDTTDRVMVARALKEAEAVARHANDAKNEFLSRMSHELRTPLNAVLGFGQLLEHHLEGTDQAASAQHVVRAGRHLLALINEVLDIATIEAGEMTVSVEAVAVAEIVCETARLMEPLAASAGVSLAIQEHSRELFVLADRVRLRQILLNLLSNAIKYNEVGGSVWLSWNCDDGEHPSIVVTDDGPGISPDLHGRLFTPFDRLGADDSGIEGSGVGLTVTRALVDLMSGELTFVSTLGAGTSFSVTLPSAPEPVTVVQGQALPQPAPFPVVAGRATVLHIEDNEANVRVMEAVVELRPEWRFIHAGKVSLGVELARAHLPDLILLDVHLPDGSGLDVLAALKGAESTAEIPVVVLSADASEPLIHRLLDAGATRYLTKPLHLVEVLTVLDSALTAKNEGRLLA